VPDISRAALSLARRIGYSFGVNGDIHNADYIYWAIRESLPENQRDEAASHYLNSGRDAARFIKTIIVEERGNAESIQVLDFASGYGRVTRHLSAMMPGCSVVGCDIHSDAVEFMSKIGLDAIQSTLVPEELPSDRKFDVIFAISFFTHMPDLTWGRWLKSIASLLAPDGILIFTTHGRAAISNMGITPNNIPPSGFRFDPHSEQKDLNMKDYASTVTYFDYVYRQSLNYDLRIVRYKEAGSGYQDLFVVKQIAPSQDRTA
jgi:SAM-dependent methyltransferase